MPTPRDYDTDPERYRLGMRLAATFTAGGAHLPSRVVDVLDAHGCHLVLDVGCGDGALAAAAASRDAVRVLGVDAAEPMTRAAHEHGPVVRAEVTALPIADAAVDAVVAVNVLDHLDDPRTGLHEACRVLRAGGLVVAGTVSRHDSPELAAVWTPTPTAFDSEDAPDLVEEVVGPVRVEPWDAPLVRLPDRHALRDYLVARLVPPDDARSRADALRARWPVTVTKRGALVVARRREGSLRRV